VNWRVKPATTDGFAGVTAIERSAAGATVRVVEPMTEPDFAVIVVAPGATLVASPVLLMVATVLADEVQAAELVRSWVVPSLYVPVAVNCCFSPNAMEGFVGVTEIVARANPNPLRGTFCGETLSVIVMLPVLVPVAVGLKVTFTVQPPLLPRLAGQLLVWVKSPLTPIAMFFTLTPLLFVIVTG
jgi:hypothetical protein